VRFFFYAQIHLTRDVIICRQRTVSNISTLKNKYWVNYNGTLMTLADFARMIGVRYNTLRGRAQRNEDMFAPLSQTPSERRSTARTFSSKLGGYTLEELAELYVKFRGSEDELEILADLACMRRHGSSVVKLQRQIEEYLEQKQMEVWRE